MDCSIPFLSVKAHFLHITTLEISASTYKIRIEAHKKREAIPNFSIASLFSYSAELFFAAAKLYFIAAGLILRAF